MSDIFPAALRLVGCTTKAAEGAVHEIRRGLDWADPVGNPGNKWRISWTDQENHLVAGDERNTTGLCFQKLLAIIIPTDQNILQWG